MSWEVEYTDQFERAAPRPGGARWYEKTVPEADLLYDRHLKALKREDERNA